MNQRQIRKSGIRFLIAVGLALASSVVLHNATEIDGFKFFFIACTVIVVVAVIRVLLASNKSLEGALDYMSSRALEKSLLRVSDAVTGLVHKARKNVVCFVVFHEASRVAKILLVETNRVAERSYKVDEFALFLRLQGPTEALKAHLSIDHPRAGSLTDFSVGQVARERGIAIARLDSIDDAVAVMNDVGRRGIEAFDLSEANNANSDRGLVLRGDDDSDRGLANHDE